ncbi:O-antigen polymerase [Gaetbulibacter sp. PBL-D1]|uniref:O-antigen polymerase n=1 Tax=Gaetbulibacter sp. PBL-D1 TaxID=3422594 RepID=UPI003D2F2323
MNDNVLIKPLPYLRIFLFIFFVVNLVGIINFPFYAFALDNGKLFLVFLLGFLGFVFGVMLIREVKFKFNYNTKGVFKPQIIYILFITINLFSFLLISLTHYLNGGILILSATKRFGTFAITNVIVYSGIIASLIFFAEKLLKNNRFKLKYIGFILLQSLFIISLGYRSPLIILNGGIAILFFTIRNDFQNRYKNIFTKKNLLVFLIIILAMSYISSFRVGLKYNLSRYYKNMNVEYFNDKPILKQFVPTLALFRFDQQMVKVIIDKTEKEPYYLGLAMANFKTLLPGSQLGVRNIVGEIVGARKMPNGKPWSITPTLQGALFIDGGYFLVFLGFFLIGSIIEYVKKLMKKRKDPFILTLYSLLTINTLMCIHTGYFDLTFYIMLIIISVFKFLTFRIKYNK